MEMTVYDDKKLVAVWLSREEKQDTSLRDKLRELYAAYRGTKYLVAVFESGEGDLYEDTLALLKYNRKRSAELAAQKEQEQAV